MSNITNDMAQRFISSASKLFHIPLVTMQQYLAEYGIDTLVHSPGIFLQTAEQLDLYQSLQDYILISEQSEITAEKLNSVYSATAYLRSVMKDIAHQESFCAVFCDGQLKPLGVEEINRGTVHSAQVDVAAVYRKALAYGASRIILGHNHPSGDCTPSPEDISITKQLYEAGKLFDITIEDHIIISSDRSTPAYSFHANHIDLSSGLSKTVVSETKESYAQKRKEEITELSSKLEAELQSFTNSEKWKECFSFLAKFWRYSWRNAVLIKAQNPKATLVAGYEDWKKKFHRQVQKGEKGIRIFAYSPYKRTIQEKKRDKNGHYVTDEKGNALTEEKTITVPSFRAVSVFDVSQTSGEPLPDLYQTICCGLDGSLDHFEPIFETLKSISPFPIKIHPCPENVHGACVFSAHEIWIAPDQSNVQVIKTALHEITHALLHNPEDPKYQPIERAVKEAQAESVAYIVCQRYGIDTSDYSLGYITLWNKSSNTQEFEKGLDIIQATAANLIEKLDETLAPLLSQDRAAAIDNTFHPEKISTIAERWKAARIRAEQENVHPAMFQKGDFRVK